MNIFALDRSPILSAQHMCDRHVIKMILESCQLLSNAHHYYNDNDKLLYKPTHKNHPCSIWTIENINNYKWLFNHFVALSKEYNLRYHKIHKSYILLYDNLIDPPNGMPDIPMTDFRQCMPDKYKNTDSVRAYRSYYVGEKLRFATWRQPAVVPDWMNIYKNCISVNILRENWIEEYFQQGVTIV